MNLTFILWPLKARGRDSYVEDWIYLPHVLSTL